jgi:MFS family permease
MRRLVPSELRSESSFLRWASAEGVSLLGSAITTVVLPLVVYDLTGSAAQTGLLFGLRVVPYLLFGLIAGPLADRGNRRRLIIGGNVIEGALVSTIPIAHLLGVLTLPQIYAVALLSATAFVFSDAAVFGAVPALVGPGRLPAANGMLSTLASMTEISGPVVAGLLVAVVGPTAAIWVDATSFFAAAAIQARIRSTFHASAGPAVPASPTAPTSATAQQSPLRAALSFVRHHRTVRTLLFAGFGNSVAFGIVLGLIVPYSVERLGLAKDDGRIGAIFAALGVGSLLAGLAFARVFAVDRIRFLTPGMLLAAAIAIAALAANQWWAAALAVVAAFSFSITTTITVGITYRQMVSPDSIRSSVNVIGRMIAWGGQPFGAALGAVLASTRSVTAAYWLAAGIMAVAASSAFLALRRGDTTHH